MGRAEVTVPFRGNPWPVPDMDIGTFESPRVYAVLDLPQLGSLPPGENIFSEKEGIHSFSTNFEPAKQDFPSIDAPFRNLSEKVDNFTDENIDDCSFDLYDDNRFVSTHLSHYRSLPLRTTDYSSSATSPKNLHTVRGDLEERSLDRFEQICRQIDPVYARVKSMTAHLDV